jgi:hypothetical protein
VLRSQKKFAAADTAISEALGNFERAFGPTHIRTSQALIMLGGVRHSLGRKRDAIPLLERGYAIQLASRGATHKDVVALKVRIDSLKRN